MVSNNSIMELPDLVLYKICTFIDCPFDLLHFGNTCSRLRQISSSSSLWWSIAFRLFRGIWIFMEEGSIEDNARDWILDVIRLYCKRPIPTKLECDFSDGEIWVRADTPKVRFLVNMIRLAYAKDKDEHPAVLYEEWLYDIGIYKRLDPCTDFSHPNLEFSRPMIQQLSSLGQASERDLRRRKQPFKDPRYYLKRVASCENSCMIELFPVNPYGSICPLLICPFQEATSNELSGVQGLAMCLSIVFERHLQKYFKASLHPLSRIWEIIKVFTTVFISEMLNLLPMLYARFETISLKSAVLIVVDESLYDFKHLQTILDHFHVNIKSIAVIHDLAVFLKNYEGVDFAVDEIRSCFKNTLIEEAKNILFPHDSSNGFVTRINLTDSDVIGGDNYRQEMAAAAFISNNGVLVTWHLTGKMRY